MGTSSLLQDETPSARTYTLCPCARRSSVVCVTQMCDSIPTITQERGGVEVVVWPWVWWVRELIAFWTWGVSMLKRLLSL